MFADPIKILKQFGFRDDMTVADLGAGSGFYTFAISKMVPFGRVYAIDIIPEILKSILNKKEDEKIKNIECILGNIEKINGTHLANNIIDKVIVSNVFSQVEDKNNFVKEIKRILKENGEVLLVDMSIDSSLFTNHKNIKYKVEKDATLKYFSDHGFVLKQEIDTGDHHYGLIFTKK